jgi:hypothetical protein
MEELSCSSSDLVFLFFSWTMEGKWAGGDVVFEQELLTVPCSAQPESVEVFLDGLAQVN